MSNVNELRSVVTTTACFRRKQLFLFQFYRLVYIEFAFIGGFRLEYIAYWQVFNEIVLARFLLHCFEFLLVKFKTAIALII